MIIINKKNLAGIADVLVDKISMHLTRPKGEESSLEEVKRIYKEFQYKAESREKERRVVAKIEWPPGELLPNFGFIVTNMKKKVTTQVVNHGYFQMFKF